MLETMPEYWRKFWTIVSASKTYDEAYSKMNPEQRSNLIEMVWDERVELDLSVDEYDDEYVYNQLYKEVFHCINAGKREISSNNPALAQQY